MIKIIRQRSVGSSLKTLYGFSNVLYFLVCHNEAQLDYKATLCGTILANWCYKRYVFTYINNYCLFGTTN